MPISDCQCDECATRYRYPREPPLRTHSCWSQMFITYRERQCGPSRRQPTWGLATHTAKLVPIHVFDAY